MKIFRILGLSLILFLTMVIPVAAKTAVVKITEARLFASNSEYTVFVDQFLEDPTHLQISIYNSSTNITENYTVPSSDLVFKRGTAILSVPDVISLTWTYDAKDTQTGKVFITNFPTTDTKLFKQFSFNNDTSLNNLKVSEVGS